MNAIDLNARASANFADKLKQTAQLLEKAALDYAPPPGSAEPRIALACSLGAEDMVLAHLINDLQLEIGIFVLDTGQLHAETLALLERLKASSRTSVQVFNPAAESVLQFVRKNGNDAMYQSIDLRKACCEVRKMEPLGRALSDKPAWITGLRREQSGARASAPLIDNADPRRIKFNPLSHWTWGDVWHFIGMKRIDYNPLHDRFYPSIGCAPCTRAISLGEDFRAGRWWWEDEAAKECGLHVTPVKSPINTPSSARQITSTQEANV